LAFRFKKEKTTICCYNGKISNEHMNHPIVHPTLNELYMGTTPKSREFLKCIRKYNQSFAFTSMRSKFQCGQVEGRGVYTFRVNGELCHLIGNLQPDLDQDAKFAQIYFLDDDLQTNRRMEIFDDLDRDIINSIQEVLESINVLVRGFKSSRDVLQRGQNMGLRISGEVPSGEHPGRYNRRVVPEVAAIVLDEQYMNFGRDIILHQHGGHLLRIKEIHPAYDALSYPLLFPAGQCGWSPTFKADTGVTLKSYVQYLLQKRPESNVLHKAGRLFQQYVVDQYLRVEHENLLFIRHHQTELRAECYQGVVDALQEDNMARIGQRIVLPATFIGSPRYMQKLFHDSMVLVRVLGKPDLFVTMTCNPTWPEILDELEPGQSPPDRPDIVVRIFELKLKALMDEITKKNVMGETIAFCYTIEFQKRGLPHAHILLWLKDKVNDCDLVDKIVCAEIPDLERQPQLYAAVAKHMMHGPCGLDNPNCPCMEDNRCTKDYPMQARDITEVDGDGHVLYRRRNHGRYIEKRVRGQIVHLDNRWVVPYNPYLTGRFNCHINVEICSSVKTVKYLHKYIFKGPDRGVVETDEVVDEIKDFLEGRYVAAQEACWRLFGFETNNKSHSICRLPVHLPGQQYVTFQEGTSLQSVIDQNAETKLTKFFELNRRIRALIASGNQGNHILLRYMDLPLHYKWDVRNNMWERRQRNIKVFGRINMVPVGTEVFYLRLLLTHVEAPTSFEDLLCFHDVVYPTYKAACIARGLLEDDTEWENCLQEATVIALPKQIRRLFATLLVFGQPLDPLSLLKTHIDAMSDDWRNDQNRYCKAILSIEEYLSSSGKHLTDFFNIEELNEFGYPNIVDVGGDANDNNDFDNQNITFLEEDVGRLNEEQNIVFNAVTTAVLNSDSPYKLFFLDGPGGTGKTFLYNTILGYLRGRSVKCMAMATSGIAACLLNEGRTAHSSLAIPLQLHDASVCSISAQSTLGQSLREVQLIVLDEACAGHRFMFEAIDRSLRDIRGIDSPNGGVVVLYGGDFRQTLPVVVRGGRKQTVQACLRHSYLFPLMQHFHLTTNMRLQSQPDFQKFLLDIGEGKTGPKVDLPLELVAPGNSLDGLIDAIFDDPIDFSERVILAVRNDDAQEINRRITDRIPGDVHQCFSADFVHENDEHAHHYPVEFLNSLQLSGLPPHQLSLKCGQYLMLLRNLNPAKGLCNGSRLRLLQVSPSVLLCKIVEGRYRSQEVLIPRITHHCNDSRLPFTLCRRQFPVTGAFAMTINKSQGQSYDRVGIYLRNEVFSHGQLYVALSRGRHPANIKVANDNNEAVGTVKNIVYHEVFT
jgi:hypothetical protein